MSFAASIVIPTRNRRGTLMPLLEHALGEAGAAGAEVIVVDNGSTDGTEAAVAEVRTAVPLDGGRRDGLAKALSEATGKDVELKVLVDPSVIGGVVARVGDQVFDGSIRRKLELAREQLVRAR